MIPIFQITKAASLLFIPLNFYETHFYLQWLYNDFYLYVFFEVWTIIEDFFYIYFGILNRSYDNYQLIRDLQYYELINSTNGFKNHDAFWN